MSVRNVAVKMPAAEVARVAAGGAETAVPSPAVVPAVPGAPVPVVPVPPFAAVPAVVLPTPERPAAADGRAKLQAGCGHPLGRPLKSAAVAAPPVIPTVSATASPVPAAARASLHRLPAKRRTMPVRRRQAAARNNQAATSAEPAPR